jgi:hypothetical protein
MGNIALSDNMLEFVAVASAAWRMGSHRARRGVIGDTVVDNEAGMSALRHSQRRPRMFQAESGGAPSQVRTLDRKRAYYWRPVSA